MMMKRHVLAFVATLVTLAGLMIGGAGYANADPTVQPGCKSASQNYDGSSVGGVLLARGVFNVRFCWTGGSITKSSINKITGSIQTTDGSSDRVSDKIGPVDAARGAIDPADAFGYHVDVHYFVDACTCVAGYCADKYTFHVIATIEPNRVYYSASKEG